jgi:hypothetical protein
MSYSTDTHLIGQFERRTNREQNSYPRRTNEQLFFQCSYLLGLGGLFGSESSES